VADYLNWFNFRIAVLHAAEKWQGALLSYDKAGGDASAGVYREHSKDAVAGKDSIAKS
jgi:hypothetical protein